MTDSPHSRRYAVPAGLKEYIGMIVAIGVLIAVFSLTTKRFFSVKTFQTIANQYAEYFVVAVGMTFVLIVGGIDLSVGSVMGLSGAVLGVLMAEYDVPVALAVPACLAVGALCGLINGLVTVTWRLPSFIVTLGMMQSARGATFLLTSSETKYVGSEIAGIAGANVLGLSAPFLIAVGVVVVGQLVLSRTVFGRHAIALGTNAEAVRLAGVDPRPVKLTVFVMSGLLAAAGAVFRTSRMESADPNAGTGFELEAIAAVVIGGTSLMGGRGSVVRSFLGVMIIAVLSSGLFQVGAPEHNKWLFTGGVIVAAVILDHYRQRLRPGGASLSGNDDDRRTARPPTIPRRQ